MAEALGKSSLLQDGFVRGLGFESKATELAERLTGEPKDLIGSFVAGANQALFEQGADIPKWIKPFTAADVLALAQFVNAAFPLLDLSAQRSAPVQARINLLLHHPRPPLATRSYRWILTSGGTAKTVASCGKNSRCMRETSTLEGLRSPDCPQASWATTTASHGR